MSRRNKTIIRDSKFDRKDTINIDGFDINSGDIIKIKGQYGSKFIFQSLTTNRETGVQWIDCIELDKGEPGAFRSFYPEYAKRIPKRRKGVSRSKSNPAS
jgi:hypothetical protein